MHWYALMAEKNADAAIPELLLLLLWPIIASSFVKSFLQAGSDTSGPSVKWYLFLSLCILHHTCFFLLSNTNQAVSLTWKKLLTDNESY